MVERFLSELDNGSKSGLIKKQIVEHFLRCGNASIPDIAKELNFSVPTISKYIVEMCEDGFLCDYGKIETKEGRHPNSYGVNADACYFVGVDIKWFELNLALMNFSGEMIDINTNTNFRFENTPQKRDEVCLLIKNYIDTLDVDKDKIINVNVNVSGRVNPESGYSFSIFNFEEQPLAEVMSERIGRHVTIENDTRSMAYGEYIKYYSGERRNVIFVNASWGIGIGVVINGEIYSGKSGYAGEFGHMSIYNNEILCHCGKKGCLETEASGIAIHRELLRRIAAGESSVLSRDVAAGRKITMLDVIDAVAREDMLCIELVEEVGQKLGKQIANLINIFNPELVIIGGTLALTGDYLMQPIKTAVRKYSLNLVSRDSQILPSKLKDKAGIYGSCMIARRIIFGIGE